MPSEVSYRYLTRIAELLSCSTIVAGTRVGLREVVGLLV